MNEINTSLEGRMRRNQFPACVVVLCFVATVVTEADQTDDFIRAQMKAQNIPGLSLAVVRNGEIVKTAGYGFANIRERLPVTPETVFHIGSISKPFVAMGIMRLVQEGRLDLDDPISNYLDGTPDMWRHITVRHVLTHTSGIVRDAPGFDAFKDQSSADVIRTAFPLPLRFTPGEKWEYSWEYSNAGFAVLGEIISKVSGRPWYEHLKEMVFKPSGMNTTYPVNTKERIPNRARGYTDNNKLLEVDDWRVLFPSGGLLSTVLDLAKWDAVLNTDRILSESSRRGMWTPVTLDNGTTYPYGLGWELSSPLRGYGPIGQYTVVSHGGSLRGFRSEFARFVDQGVTIIILMNSDDVDWRVILYGVARAYLPSPEPPRNR